MQNHWMVLDSSAANVRSDHFFNNVFILRANVVQIVGSKSKFRSLFEKVGIQPTEQPLNITSCPNLVYGQYNCSSPPTIGFQVTPTGPIMQVHSQARSQSEDNEICTVSIVGVDGYEDDMWTLGQA